VTISVFFFKQKKAYEIPKRDWRSDVCSSDLRLESAAANIEEHSGANLYARLMREASDAILQLRNQVADLTSKLPPTVRK